MKKKLDINPEVVWGKEAVVRVKNYIRLTRGLYVWENDKDLVAVRDNKRIGILAHEMRHAWQYKNRETNKLKFKQPPKRKYLRMIGSLVYKHNYAFDKREHDANLFAIDYCNSVGLQKEAKRMRNEIIINNITKYLVISMDIMFLVLVYVIYKFISILV